MSKIVGGNWIAAMTGGVFYTTPVMGAGSHALLLSPAMIMVAYVIEKLDKMTDPSDGDDWPLYTSHMPDSLDVKTDCGAIFGTGGVNDPRGMEGGVSQHPGVQLRIRSKSHSTGYAKIEDVASTLDGVMNDTITISGKEYAIQNVSRASPIVDMGVEPGTKRRFSFTVNYLLTMKRLTD